MDVVERLSLEAASADASIAADHLHRYELAAELCDGLRVADVGCGEGHGARVLRSRARAVLGVDRDAAVTDRARTLGGGNELEFEAADAAEFLRRDLESSFDALVVLDALERLPDPEPALSELARHASAGMRLVVALPNGDAFGDRDPRPATAPTYERGVAMLRALGDDVLLLHQFNAEGSLIRPPDASELGGRFVLGEHGEPERCNQLIACVNFGSGAPTKEWSRMELTVAPDYNRRMIELERANRELSRANARLARERIGSADSAASALLERLERSEELRMRMERSLSWRITAPIRLVKGPLRRAFPRPWLKAVAARVLPARAFTLLRAIVRRLRQGRVDATRPR